MKRRSLLLNILVLSALFYSCTPKEVPAEKLPSSVNPTAQSKTAEEPVWEEEWGNVLREAGKEGKVVLYMTGAAEVRLAISRAFQGKYGITVEAIVGTGGQLSERLLRERRASLYYGDVYLGGVTTPLVALKPAGVLDSFEPAFILPEFRDQEIIKKTWWLGKLPWIDKEKQVFGFLAFPNPWITINTELAKEEEFKSHKDLLDPRWKGKIIMFDPSITGIGSKQFGTVAEFIMGMDYWREFARQEPLIVRDHRTLAEWVARGKYPVGYTVRPGEVAEFRKAGASIKMLARPVEGVALTTGSGGLGLINNASHRNAARIFINWLLSKEGLTVWTRAHDTTSGRLDVPADFVSPENMRQSGVKYIWTETEEYLLKEPKLSAMAQEIFNIR